MFNEELWLILKQARNKKTGIFVCVFILVEDA